MKKTGVAIVILVVFVVADWLPTVLQVGTLGLAAVLTIYGAKRFGRGAP